MYTKEIIVGAIAVMAAVVVFVYFQFKKPTLKKTLAKIEADLVAEAKHWLNVNYSTFPAPECSTYAEYYAYLKPKYDRLKEEARRMFEQHQQPGGEE